MVSYEQLAENYASALIGNVSFGVYLMLACAAIHLLLQRRRRNGGQNIALIYTLAMLVVTIIWEIAGSRMSAYWFVDLPFDRAPADPTCGPAGILLKVTATLQIFLSDGLLMFRTYVIWENTWQIVVVPTLLYVASFAVGITMNLACAIPAIGEVNLKLHEAFFVMTIACNVFSTAAIAARLVMHRRALRSIGMASRPSFSEYTTVAGVLAESAALYAIVGILYLPFYMRQGPGAAVLSSVFQALVVLSPAVIILRVALGISYDKGPQSTTVPWHTTGDTPTELSPATPKPHDPPPAWMASSSSSAWDTEKYASQHSVNIVGDDMEMSATNHRHSKSTQNSDRV